MQLRFPRATISTKTEIREVRGGLLGYGQFYNRIHKEDREERTLILEKHISLENDFPQDS